MGGGAPAVDSDGYVYVIASDDAGNPESIYEDAFLKFNPDLTVADYFQTSIDPTLIKNDADQGSGGIMILPDNSSGTPHELVGGGKDGFIIILNRDNLGQEHATDQAIEEVKTGVGEYSNIFSSPAFWNNTLYYHPENDTLHLFNYDPATGKIGTSPAKSGSAVYGWQCATPSISANGSSDGIVWEIEQTAWKTGGAAILHAYDAVSAAELYNSTQAAGNRDKAGPAVRFTLPTVADGQVFRWNRQPTGHLWLAEIRAAPDLVCIAASSPCAERLKFSVVHDAACALPIQVSAVAACKPCMVLTRYGQSQRAPGGRQAVY